MAATCLLQCRKTLSSVGEPTCPQLTGLHSPKKSHEEHKNMRPKHWSIDGRNQSNQLTIGRDDFMPFLLAVGEDPARV
jgi:hypothetical protein